MVSLGGSFFTKDGIVPDEALLKKQIYEELKAFVTAGLSKKVSGLLEVLRMECCVESLPIQEDRIHVENGTLYLDGSFSEEKSFCRNRLPVRYNPNAGKPVQWKAFAFFRILKIVQDLVCQEAEFSSVGRVRLSNGVFISRPEQVDDLCVFHEVHILSFCCSP